MTSVSCRMWPSWQHKCDPCGPRGTLSLTRYEGTAVTEWKSQKD